MSHVHISVVVNAHREGLLAPPSLRSAQETVRHARNAGLNVETIAVLDRPDQTTLEVFGEFADQHDQVRVLPVDHGDLGHSRNSGVEAAHGDWIGFLDADDLWSANWLIDSYRAGEADARSVVWHSEVNVYFGLYPHLYLHADMEDDGFDPAILALTNCWTSLCFTRRSLLASVPYPTTTLKAQIGYEDWGWNMEAVARGAIHKVVRGTAHAIRMKEGSLLRQTTAAGCLPRASDMFMQILQARKSALPQERANRGVHANQSTV